MIPALRETTTDAIFFSLRGDGLGIRKNNLNLPECSGQP